jgi:hypothetical protein
MKLGLVSVARRLGLRRGGEQRLLPFQEKSARLARVFRGLIIAVTVLALAAIWAAWPTGRATALGMVERAKWRVQRSIGLEPPRSEVDAYWRARRARREVTTRERYRKSFETLAPKIQAFFRAAGMDPDEAVLRWGNYDMTLVMSNQVLARNDAGRQYQLLPHVRSAWYRELEVLGMDVCIFLLPDTPKLNRLAAEAGAEIVPGLFQTTNSWGCRGPEPDPNAPLRGLVLGDSFMQGFFVNDSDSPPEQLRKSLQAEIGAEVSILNTGTLGYCPEHYYYTLLEFVDRFRPRFVVVGLYSNDFGEDKDVLRGDGDWTEEQHWLELILQRCRARGVLCLFAPVPCESQLAGPRNQGNYPGQVSNLIGLSGRLFCDSTDAFIDEDLKLRPPWNPAISLSPRSPLYNGLLADGHLSPKGTAIWGRTVAHRLALLIGKDLASSEATAEGVGSAANQSTAN